MNPDRDAWEKHVEGRTRANLRETERLGAAAVRIPDVTRTSKYHARAVAVDGILFDSTKEATRYQELKLLRDASAIVELVLQPRFPIQVVELYRGGPPWVITHCGMYTADFQYVDTATGEIVVEDVKSDATKLTAYRLRKRLVEAIHGISIREV